MDHGKGREFSVVNMVFVYGWALLVRGCMLIRKGEKIIEALVRAVIEICSKLEW